MCAHTSHGAATGGATARVAAGGHRPQSVEPPPPLVAGVANIYTYKALSL